MNNEETVNSLPNSILDKYTIHVGSFKEGDCLIETDIIDGAVLGANNIYIDRVDGLEARLTKERMTTENEINEVHHRIQKETDRLESIFKESGELNKNRFTEMYKNIIDLEDTVRSNRITKEDEIEHIHKILFWLSAIAFLIMGFLSFSVIYLFEKI